MKVKPSDLKPYIEPVTAALKSLPAVLEVCLLNVQFAVSITGVLEVCLFHVQFTVSI